jgi:hypothetical protein
LRHRQGTSGGRIRGIVVFGFFVVMVMGVTTGKSLARGVTSDDRPGVAVTT